MRGLGTAVNVATVLAGTGVGVLAGRRVPEQLRATLLTAAGLITVVLGVRDAGATRNLVIPLVAVLLGGLVGELLRLEDGLEGLGGWLRRRLGVAEDEAEGFVGGFVSASLLFCVGPLTILGSISDGLGRGAEDLLVKAALDGTMAVVLASSLGWGVGLSALTVLAVQGPITAAAGALEDLLSDRMVDELTATGGVVLLGLALRLLELRRVRVGSFLPALVAAPLLVAAFGR